MSFIEMLRERWQKANSLVCVGLDPDASKISEALNVFSEEWMKITKFIEKIVDATHDLVCAYKPNRAFFSAKLEGEQTLKNIIQYIHDTYPGIPVILDAKVNDIGNTSEMYVKEVFDKYGADAVTINPYLGMDACQPFLDRKEKGIIVLCKTSNPGGGEFQNLISGAQTFYEIVADHVARDWNKNGNCGLVVGATYPKELAGVRQIVGDDMPILIPGMGRQGGDVEATVKAGRNNMIINSSRDILYASSGEDFAEKARAKTLALRDEINKYR